MRSVAVVVIGLACFMCAGKGRAEVSDHISEEQCASLKEKQSERYKVLRGKHEAAEKAFKKIRASEFAWIRQAAKEVADAGNAFLKSLKDDERACIPAAFSPGIGATQKSKKDCLNKINIRLNALKGTNPRIKAVKTVTASYPFPQESRERLPLEVSIEESQLGLFYKACKGSICVSRDLSAKEDDEDYTQTKPYENFDAEELAKDVERERKKLGYMGESPAPLPELLDYLAARLPEDCGGTRPVIRNPKLMTEGYYFDTQLSPTVQDACSAIALAKNESCDQQILDQKKSREKQSKLLGIHQLYRDKIAEMQGALIKGLDFEKIGKMQEVIKTLQAQGNASLSQASKDALRDYLSQAAQSIRASNKGIFTPPGCGDIYRILTQWDNYTPAFPFDEGGFNKGMFFDYGSGPDDPRECNQTDDQGAIFSVPGVSHSGRITKNLVDMKLNENNDVEILAGFREEYPYYKEVTTIISKLIMNAGDFGKTKEEVALRGKNEDLVISVVINPRNERWALNLGTMVKEEQKLPKVMSKPECLAGILPRDCRLKKADETAFVVVTDQQGLKIKEPDYYEIDREQNAAQAQDAKPK